MYSDKQKKGGEVYGCGEGIEFLRSHCNGSMTCHDRLHIQKREREHISVLSRMANTDRLISRMEIYDNLSIYIRRSCFVCWPY